MMKRCVVFLLPVLTMLAMLEAFPAKAAAQHGVPFDGFAELNFATDGSVFGEGEGTVLGSFTEVACPVIVGNNVLGEGVSKGRKWRHGKQNGDREDYHPR